MAKALKRNGGRLRENPRYINGNMCKDSEGNWSKWVLERCSESERIAYNAMCELCKQDPVASQVSENHKLRYLNGFNFDADLAFKALVEAEETRFKYCCDTLT